MSDNELIAEFNEAKWRIEYSKYSTYCNIIDADGYVGTIQGREKAELIARAPALLSEVSTLRSKQAELVAERDREKADAEKWYKKYNEMSEIAFKSANKASDQSAEIERLKSQLKDYCNDCQHPSVNERQATELSKLRQENERYKEALQCMMNVEHHGDFMNAFFDLKDQVKAALQGE